MTTEAVSVSRAEPRALAQPIAILPILIALFLLSGISGLTYQVVWLRVLGHVFGVTVWAASTVLASFMAGLALGSFLAGRISPRIRNPLLWYGVAELLVGISAVLTPAIFAGLESFYVWLYPSLPGELVALTVVRFVLCFAVLLVPTTLMGATLPLVVKSSLWRGEDMGRSVSLLYATNTLGALFGVVATGFYLIGSIGVMNTFYVGLIINVVVGLIAVLTSRFVGGGYTPVDAEAARAARVRAAATEDRGLGRVRLAVLLVFGLSGFTSLAYEVIWFRVLTHYQQVTTYAFTVMLATFLLGIALGSYLVAPVIRRKIDWLPWLALVEVLIGLSALASVYVMAGAYTDFEPFLSRIGNKFVPIMTRFGPEELMTDLGFLTALAGVSMGPTTLLLGLAFPIGVQIYASRGDRDDVGAPLGRFYAVNTIGAILGSALAGFLLLPALGSQHSIGLLSALNILGGLALLWAWPKLRVRLPSVSLATAGSLALAALLILPAPDLLGSILSGRYRDFDLLFHEEGIQTSVSVQSSPTIANILFLDGSHQANDTEGGVRLHRMIGHMPMLLHPDPKRALVIGLGGGATAGAVSQYDGVQVDIVELAPAVVHGSAFFRHVNYDVLNQPNVHLRLDDGRNYMLLTHEKYDVITADIVHPWHAGAGNLYSTEYYTLAKNALTDDGLMCQWIDTVGETEFKLLMRSFVSVFPYVTYWFEGNLMVGSKTPIYFDPDVIARKLASPRTHAALAQVGANTPQDVLSWYNSSRPQLLRYLGDGPVITDNSPYVEYFHTLPAKEVLRNLDAMRSPTPAEIVKPK